MAEPWSTGGIMEVSTVIDNDGKARRWYRGQTPGSSWPSYFGYAESTNMVDWAEYFEPIDGGMTAVYINTFVYNGRVYLLGRLGTVDSGSPPIYMYDVTDPLDPQVMNNGNALFTPATAGYTVVYNPGPALVGNRLHVLWDTTTTSGATFDQFYTYCDLPETLTPSSTLTVHITHTPVLTRVGCVSMTHVPERNALLVIGSYYSSPLNLRAYYASLTSDLTKAASWHYGGVILSKTGIILADNELTEGIGGDMAYSLYLTYNYDQTSTGLAVSNLTLTQLYDSVVAGTCATAFNNIRDGGTDPIWPGKANPYGTNTPHPMAAGRTLLPALTSEPSEVVPWGYGGYDFALNLADVIASGAGSLTLDLAVAASGSAVNPSTVSGAGTLTLDLAVAGAASVTSAGSGSVSLDLAVSGIATVVDAESRAYDFAIVMTEPTVYGSGSIALDLRVSGNPNDGETFIASLYGASHASAPLNGYAVVERLPDGTSHVHVDLDGDSWASS